VKANHSPKKKELAGGRRTLKFKNALLGGCGPSTST